MRFSPLAVSVLTAGGPPVSLAVRDLPLLKLDAPLSFWGGLDPKTGQIIDRQHPQCGASMAGKVLYLPGVRGSTAAPGALLENLAAGAAPAAFLLPRFEPVPWVALLAGALIDLAPVPVAVLDSPADAARLRSGQLLRIDGQDWFAEVS